MWELENYLQSCLGNKELIKKYISKINTETLIEILKVLNEELKKRIDEFNKSKEK